MTQLKSNKKKTDISSQEKNNIPKKNKTNSSSRKKDNTLNKKKTNISSNDNNNIFKQCTFTVVVLSYICFLTWFATNNYLKYRQDLKIKNNILTNNNNINNKVPPLSNFQPVSQNGTKGPISINKDLDDGTKFNLYNMMRETDESFNSFFYDEKEFQKLSPRVEMEEEYLCELPLPSEGTEGYYLTCPQHYTLVIDKANYGRYASDLTHCSKTWDGQTLDKSNLELSEDCLQDTLAAVQELCEGRTQCTLKPNASFFGNPCTHTHNYLHVQYHCLKNKDFKKPKFAIVTYADRVQVNSIYDNAISEIYQYADIHNYTFLYFNQKYDQDRSVYYMKLHVVHEALVRGLKTKEYDWVFWTDSDIIIANPNIKLENFIPTDEKKHFIIATDHHGLNAGVFMIRVHPWSLNFIMRCLAYQLFYPTRYLEYSDQTSINDILSLNEMEKPHYVIVPQSWFNAYPDKRLKGDMLIHFAGRKNQTLDSIITRHELIHEDDYITSKTNRMMRKEVLEYYNLPQDQQRQITFVKYFHYFYTPFYYLKVFFKL